jgi:hypothetical protein
MQVQITINVKGNKLDVEQIVYELSEYVIEKDYEAFEETNAVDYIDIEVIRTKPYNQSV